VSEIAKQFGVSIGVVRSVLKSAGLVRQMESRPRVSDEVKSGIIRERKNGATFTAIEKQFGISRSTVRKSLREAGLLAPQPPDPEQQKRDQEIAELRRQGTKLADIGKKYGLTLGQVFHALDRYNKTADDPVPVTSPPTARQMAKRMKKIEKLARSGLTYKQIADALELSKQYVRELVREHNHTAEHPIKVRCEKKTRKKPKKYDEFRNEIIEEYKNGATFAAMAEQFGISRSTVRVVLQDAEVYRPQERQGLANDEVKNEIIKERKKGTKLSAIAEQFEISVTTVKKVLREAGLVRPRLPESESLDDFVRKFWNKDHRAVDMLLDPKDVSSEEVVKLINEALLYAYEQRVPRSP
jgi:transposase-like protein